MGLYGSESWAWHGTRGMVSGVQGCSADCWCIQNRVASIAPDEALKCYDIDGFFTTRQVVLLRMTTTFSTFPLIAMATVSFRNCLYHGNVFQSCGTYIHTLKSTNCSNGSVMPTLFQFLFLSHSLSLLYTIEATGTNSRAHHLSIYPNQLSSPLNKDEACS